jgi:hypothetical protein
MRLKSEIWISAYLRVCTARGQQAVLVRRGDAHAGAIFIRVVRLDGTSDLFGPAPAGYDVAESDRSFVSLFSKGPRSDREVDEFIVRQASFDPDLWVVEVEDRLGRHGLEDWLMRS